MKMNAAGVLGWSAAVVCAAGLALSATSALRADTDDERTTCASNLRQVGLATLMYVQDYDNTLPPTASTPKTERVVEPYAKSVSLFVCPTSGKHYVFNPALNGLLLTKVTNPATTVLCRDAVPHVLPDGKKLWYTAFVDGHVKGMATEPKLGKAPAPAKHPAPRHAHKRH